MWVLELDLTLQELWDPEYKSSLSIVSNKLGVWEVIHCKGESLWGWGRLTRHSETQRLSRQCSCRGKSCSVVWHIENMISQTETHTDIGAHDCVLNQYNVATNV